MEFEDAVKSCHVRSGIYRTGDTTKVYWKNHNIPIEERVPKKDQTCCDWAEYDPREQPECSAFNEMPA